jgi:hypothetical protein
VDLGQGGQQIGEQRADGSGACSGEYSTWT